MVGVIVCAAGAIGLLRYSVWYGSPWECKLFLLATLYMAAGMFIVNSRCPTEVSPVVAAAGVGTYITISEGAVTPRVVCMLVIAGLGAAAYAQTAMCYAFWATAVAGIALAAAYGMCGGVRRRKS